MSHVIKMLGNSQANDCEQMEFPWMSSAEGFPVRTSARPGLALAWREVAAAFGENTPDSFARLDPVSSSWRTSQLCFYRGFGDILRDLAASGYDAEWDCIPASAFGAPHRRDRLWLVAYPNLTYTRKDWTESEISVRQCEVKSATLAKGKHITGNGFGPNLWQRAMWATPTINGNYNRKGASATSGDGLATQLVAH